MIEITSSGSNLVITQSGSSLTKAKNLITKVENNEGNLRIWFTNGERDFVWCDFKPKGKVTVPTFTSTNDLVNTIQGYLKDYVSFTATALQTSFSVSGYLNLNDNFIVFVNKVPMLSGYTRTGDAVVFTDGIEEGTEVIIQKL